MEDQITKAVKALSGFGAQQMEEVGVAGFVFVMIVSLACSVFVAHCYAYFYGGRSTGSQIHRAFPLLGISITSIFITIQFSLPLSLGLLGALSIVRFRTPIKEPEEIGFLMLVIAASISCATFNFIFLGVVLVVAIVALVGLNWGILNQEQGDGMLLVTLPSGGHGPEYSALLAELDRNTRQGRLESISRNDGQAVISYAFKGLKGLSLEEFQQSLDRVLGQSSYDLVLNQQRIA